MPCATKLKLSRKFEIFYYIIGSKNMFDNTNNQHDTITSSKIEKYI